MNKFTIASVIGASLLPFAEAEQKRPNIVVFLVDDMGVMDTSVPFMTDKSGKPQKHPFNNFYKTPAMERLAAQGVRFSTCYANSVSSPTRASIMTGQSSARHRTTQWINPFGKNSGPKEWNWAGLDKDSVTLAKTLKKSGYHTIHCGKGHFAPVKHDGENPQNIGFDVNIAGSSIGRPASYYGEKSYGKGNGRAVPGLDKYHGTKTFLTEALTLEVNEAITKVAKTKQPFFVYMSHYAVHGPFNSDPRFADNYKDSGKGKAGQAFATLIEGMDKSLNDMMNHLEKIGEAENTIILFLGDNGSAAPIKGANGTKILSCAPLRGKKGSSYEGGFRVPFITAWAKVDKNSKLQKKFPVKQGIITKEFASVEDIFPTVLKLARIRSPKNHKIDGVDLTPYFATHKGNKEQEFLMHFPHNHISSYFTSYREGDWKIIYYYPAPNKKQKAARKVELFDLSTDISESKNLAKENPKQLKAMFDKMVKALDDADALYNVDVNGEEVRPVLN